MYKTCKNSEEQSVQKVRFSVFSDMCAHWKRSLSNFKRAVSLALPKPCQRKSYMFINKCMQIILTHPKSKRQQHLKFRKYRQINLFANLLHSINKFIFQVTKKNYNAFIQTFNYISIRTCNIFCYRIVKDCISIKN